MTPTISWMFRYRSLSNKLKDGLETINGLDRRSLVIDSPRLLTLIIRSKSVGRGAVGSHHVPCQLQSRPLHEYFCSTDEP